MPHAGVQARQVIFAAARIVAEGMVETLDIFISRGERDI